MIITQTMALLLAMISEERRRRLSSSGSRPGKKVLSLCSLCLQEKDVNKLFNTQNPRKAAGPDSVSPSTLKHCADQLSPVFTEITDLQHHTGDMSCASLLQSLHHHPRPQNAKGHWTEWLQTRRPDLCGHEVVWALGVVPHQILNQPTPGPTAVCLQSQQVCRRCSKHGPALHPPASGLKIQDLKWELNIRSLTKKAQQRMFFIQQLRKFNLPKTTMVHFYTILTSSITVWYTDLLSFLICFVIPVQLSHLYVSVILHLRLCFVYFIMYI